MDSQSFAIRSHPTWSSRISTNSFTRWSRPTRSSLSQSMNRAASPRRKATTGTCCGLASLSSHLCGRTLMNIRRSTIFLTRVSSPERTDAAPTSSKCKKSSARRSLTSFPTLISYLMSSLTFIPTSIAFAPRIRTTCGSSSRRIPLKAREFT